MGHRTVPYASSARWNGGSFAVSIPCCRTILWRKGKERDQPFVRESAAGRNATRGQGFPRSPFAGDCSESRFVVLAVFRPAPPAKSRPLTLKDPLHFRPAIRPVERFFDPVSKKCFARFVGLAGCPATVVGDVRLLEQKSNGSDANGPTPPFAIAIFDGLFGNIRAKGTVGA